MAKSRQLPARQDDERQAQNDEDNASQDDDECIQPVGARDRRSELQANAILEMPLRRLAALERKKLEEELDVKIFERGASEVTVTPLGEEIVRQAQSVLEQAAAIKEIAKRGKDPLAGPLTLGVIYTIGPYLLPDLVRQAIKRSPQMPLMLHTAISG